MGTAAAVPAGQQQALWPVEGSPAGDRRDSPPSPDRSGVTCRNGSGRGRRSMNGTGCGRRTGRGNVCCSRSRPPRMLRGRLTGTSRWTPPSSALITTRPAPAPIRPRSRRHKGGPAARTPGRNSVAEPACPPGGGGAGSEGLGRSRGGFTGKLHLSADGRCRPLSLIVTPGQRADCTQFKQVLDKIRIPKLVPGRPRKKPDSLAADKAYSNGLIRTYLRRRGIRHTIPEKADSQAARLRKAHAADGHPASTKSGTRSATPSNGRSTGSSSTGPSPPAMTSAATSSSAQPPQQHSSSGSEHDRPDKS